jgi:hypothetical protein
MGGTEVSAVEARFWAKVIRLGPDECWPWNAFINPEGYGHFGTGDGKVGRAHRVAYQFAVGPIPEGLVIDHTCHTEECLVPGNQCPHRACCNPQHLVPATHGENLRRGNSGRNNSAKTHCPKDHEYTEENTLLHWDRGTIRRRCRTCEDVRVAARRVK